MIKPDLYTEQELIEAVNKMRVLTFDTTSEQLAKYHHDSLRYEMIRELLINMKWGDVDFLTRPDEDEKYITPESFDAAVDSLIMAKLIHKQDRLI